MDIAQLSGALSPNGYRAGELERGLRIERRRLGSRRLLAVANQQRFDIDGLTEYAYPLESFDEQTAAEKYVKDLSASLKRHLVGRNLGIGNWSWQLESDGYMPILAGAYASSPLRVLFDRTFKVRASDYNTLYTCMRVVGPFHGHVVDGPLLEFLNAPEELRSYFRDAGSAEADSAGARDLLRACPWLAPRLAGAPCVPSGSAARSRERCGAVVPQAAITFLHGTRDSRTRGMIAEVFRAAFPVAK